MGWPARAGWEASSPLPWLGAEGPQRAGAVEPRARALLDSQRVSPLPPTTLSPFPSPLSSHLAMARKANSTFMPVLALVSMKGTPYSCQGEQCPQDQPLVAPTRHPAHRAATHPGERLSVFRADHPLAAHICLQAPAGGWGGSLWGRKL